MKISELIYRIKSLFPEKDSSQSGKIYDNRLIYNKLTSVRNRLITQQYTNHSFVGQWSYQSFLIELELVDNPFDDSSYKKKMLRSVNKIPKILSTIDKHLIQSCTNVDGTIRFFITSWKNMNYIKSNKYLKDKIHYLIFNDYLYIINSSILQKVLLTAVFVDPISIYTSSTDYMEEEFPIDDGNIDSLISLTLQELIPNLKNDKGND